MKTHWLAHLFASVLAVHDYLNEMNREVLKYDIMKKVLVTKDRHEFLLIPKRHELNMSYHFAEKGKYKTMNPNCTNLAGRSFRWEVYLSGKVAHKPMYLGNHDQPRMVTRWVADVTWIQGSSSKMLTTFFIICGHTYYYYGDELGTTNIKLTALPDYRDIEIMAEYGKVTMQAAISRHLSKARKNGGARDNGRTPMQWTAGVLTAGLPPAHPG